MTLVAYGDESMRQRRDGSGIYVFASPVFDLAHAEDLRIQVAKLGRGRRPFHWRDEEDRDRQRAVEAVAEMDALHFVVVGMGLDGVRQERHRRQCLLRLL